jgi:outer membrane immunogenic protein
MKVVKAAAIAIAVAVPIGTPAMAADPARPSYKALPAPAPAPVYNWTGFYTGIAGGLAWGQSQFVDADPTNLNGLLGSPITKKFDVSGGIFGGTVGYNWQFNNWVTGLEGDFILGDQAGRKQQHSTVQHHGHQCHT